MLKEILWITGMPRSGSTWVSQIFASSPEVRLKHCPFFSYEFKNALDERSTAKQWADFFPKVYATKGEYLDQEYLRSKGAVPFFAEKDPSPPWLAIKSTRFHNLTEHILKIHPKVRFVGIVRHPCASIHSWLTNPLEFPAGADPNKEWRFGKCRKNGPGEFWGFEDWKMVASLFLRLERQWPERFLLVRYEDIVLDPQGSIRNLFGRLGILFHEQTAIFLKDSQSKHSNYKRSVFKDPSVKDRWKTEMAPELTEIIMNELKNTAIETFI